MPFSAVKRKIGGIARLARKTSEPERKPLSARNTNFSTPSQPPPLPIIFQVIDFYTINLKVKITVLLGMESPLFKNAPILARFLLVWGKVLKNRYKKLNRWVPVASHG
jgi:hypothetical protein